MHRSPIAITRAQFRSDHNFPRRNPLQPPPTAHPSRGFNTRPKGGRTLTSTPQVRKPVVASTCRHAPRRIQPKHLQGRFASMQQSTIRRCRLAKFIRAATDCHALPLHLDIPRIRPGLEEDADHVAGEQLPGIAQSRLVLLDLLQIKRELSMEVVPARRVESRQASRPQHHQRGLHLGHAMPGPRGKLGRVERRLPVEKRLDRCQGVVPAGTRYIFCRVCRGRLASNRRSSAGAISNWRTNRDW